MNIKRLMYPLLLLVLSSTFYACEKQPVDTQPGYVLPGEDSSELVSDWSFTDGIQEIFIETDTWYGLPHSVTIWCATVDGNLYIGTYGEKKGWVRNIESSPKARLSIDSILYDVEILPISDEKLARRVDDAFHSKYDMQEVFGPDVPEWTYYSVRQLAP